MGRCGRVDTVPIKVVDISLRGREKLGFKGVVVIGSIGADGSQLTRTTRALPTVRPGFNDFVHPII